MSFNEITQEYSPKSIEFTVSFKGKELAFKAVEISVLKSEEIAIARANGQPWLTTFISSSIVDSDGNRMTLIQAEKLSEAHVDLFLNKAFEVNKKGKSEKN